MSKPGELTAMISLLDDDPAALLVPGLESRIVLMAMRSLVELGMTTRALLERICWSFFQKELLVTVGNALIRRGRIKEMIDEIISWPEENFAKGPNDDGLSVVEAAEFISAQVQSPAEWEGFEQIFRNPSHPLNAHLCPDIYWGKAVRWYLRKKDYLRAWEELTRAGRGFLREGVEHEYLASISEEAMSTLVLEIYGMMTAVNRLPPTPKIFETVPGLEFCDSVDLWSLSPSKYKPALGLTTARKYFLGSCRVGELNLFTANGGIFLAIARWAWKERKKRRERNRRKAKRGKK